MKDKLSQLRLLALHPQKIDNFQGFIEEGEAKYNCVLRIVQGKRTPEYQHSLYLQPWDGLDNDKDGKIDEKDEKVTNSDFFQSAHVYGLAIDVAKMSDDLKKVLSYDTSFLEPIAAKWGLYGGWHFGDNDHWEIIGFNWREYYKKLKGGLVDKKGFILL